jgi:DUF4097 and DUF4098 domain-containing protein YvlB
MRFRLNLLFVALTCSLAASQVAVTGAQKNVREETDLPVREEINRRYPLAPGGLVEVSYILGTVEIEATDSDQAEVDIVRSAHTRADLERFDRINIEHSPARLVLRGDDSSSGGIEVRHRVRLRLPRQTGLSVREVNGRVNIAGVAGDIRMSDVNGGASVMGSVGALELSGINGGITVSIARLATGGARLSDINGAVELRLADGLDATLEIRELDQRPQVETSRVVVSRMGEKSFHGQIGAGGPLIRVHDVNGKLRISGD